MTSRKKIQRRHGGMKEMLIVIFVLLLLVGVLSVSTTKLEKKAQQYTARETELAGMISQEQKRSEELQSYSVYTQTLKYIEELAREKLGLIYPNETVIKPNP